MSNADLLTRQDLCDQCDSAPAKVIVKLAAGGALQFCTHHYRANADKLRRPLVDTTYWTDNPQDFKRSDEFDSLVNNIIDAR